MSTATKKSIVKKVQEFKHQLNVCAELIDVCIQQGTIR